MEAQGFALDQAIGAAAGADHPDPALAVGAVDLCLAIGLHAQGGVLVDADADDAGVAALQRGTGHEHDEASEPVAFVEMGVGDHALQVGHLQEAAVEGHRAAHRVGQGAGGGDAAAVHRAVGIAPRMASPALVPAIGLPARTCALSARLSAVPFQKRM